MKERYQKIGDTKRFTTNETLCEGHPRQFLVYMRTVRQLEFSQDPDVGRTSSSLCFMPFNDQFFFLFQYDGLRRVFHNALNENNLINDGDFDWVRRLQEHRLNRSKTTTMNNTTTAGVTSTNVPPALSTGVTANSTNKNANTIMNASSSSMLQTPTNRTNNHHNESRNRSAVSRNLYQQNQLPLSSTNRSTNPTTATLNGGSKTTLSMASTSKIQGALPQSSSRTAIENHRPEPPPTKRRGLVPAPPPLPHYSYQHTHQQQHSANVNNSNNTHMTKEQHISTIVPPSEPTCCFFKRKAKRALQITSTTPRKV